MVKPKFLKEIREDGIPVRKFKTEVINPSICSERTLGFAQGMLKGVVTNGTGRSLQSPYYTLAGKTGTAVIADDNKGYTRGGAKKYQASFCGYFPADNPRYSCIVVIVGPKGKFYGGSVAGPVFRGIADKVYAAYLEPAADSIPPFNEVPAVKSGLKADVLLFEKELGFKTQSQNLTADHVVVSADSMTVFVKGVNDIPGTVPDVLGMGANDAVFLLEEAGFKTEINGFGRVFRQSPSAGMPVSKGALISMDLGFDELQIMKIDTLVSGDSIQTQTLIAVPAEKTKEQPKATASKPKPDQAAIDRWKAKVAAQKAQEKPKPDQASIDRWKAKVAAEKAKEKAKPDQAAIDRWKAKVAAEKEKEKERRRAELMKNDGK